MKRFNTRADMLFETQTGPFAKVYSTNATDTSFPSRIPRRGLPSGTGIIEMAAEGGGGASQNQILFVPYAVAGDNDTFSMRIIGWRSVGLGETLLMGIPVLLAEIACTCCTVVGIAGGEVIATERFVDTITLVSGNDDVSIDINSPTGDVIAHVLVDAKGFQKVEATFDSTAGGTTSMNSLYALI